MTKKTRKLFIFALSASGIVLMTGCATARPPVDWSQECGPATQGHYRNIRFGDLNRDGLMDMVCACTNPGGIKAWLGRGDGTWVYLCDVTSRGKCYDVALADVNTDGWLDIVAVGLGELLGVRTWLSNADGTLSQRYNDESPWIEDPMATPSKKGMYGRVEVADVNNDGAIDIIAASTLDGQEGGINVWLGSGENEWVRGGDVVAQGIFRDIAVGDINLDGTVDVAATAFRVPGGIFVWYGSGGGEWFGGEPPTDQGSFWGIAGGDFNCDGLIDIVASNYQQRGLYIWHRQAEGGWESPVRLCRDGIYARIKVADFDSDTWLDFAASSVDRGGLDLWLRKPEGWQAQHIGESYGAGYGSGYHGLDIADLNDDGLTDVASVSIKQGVEAWIQTGPEQIITVSPKVAEQGAMVRGGARARTGGICALPERTGEKGNKVFRFVPDPRGRGGKPFPEYIIGTRDVLQVAVHTGLEKTTYEETVSGDGTLYIPDISGDPIEAADKTPTELREEVIQILGASLKKPHAEVVVSEFGSKFSTLSGEIRVTIRADTGPGKYPLKGMIRVLDFINAHGGPTDAADLTRVLMIAPDGTQRYLNLQKAIEEGDAGENLVVDHEDFIHLPKKGRTVRKIYVLGEVTAPGVYPILGGERVLDGIAMAGGPNRRTLKRGLYVVRGDADSPEIRRVDLVALMTRGDYSQNLQLRDGDILYAPQRFITKLHDLIADVSPLLNAIGTYEDAIVSLDNLGWSDVWHKVGNTSRSRITVTTTP